MKYGIRILSFLLVCGLMVALLPDRADAVNQDNTPRMDSDRGWIIVTWNASGTMGGWNLGEGMTGEPDMFMYPGWNNLPSTNATTNYTRKWGNAVGFGVWLTSRGPSGTLDMSWQGPRGISDDIVPLVYDPSAGPEKDLGVTDLWEQNRSGSFASASNYWPGATVPPETSVDAPRKISNFSPGKYKSVANDAFPDQLVISKWKDKQDITVTRKAYEWSHQDFSDFVIADYTLENTGTDTRNDVYLTLVSTWKISEMADNMLGGGRWWSWQDEGFDDYFRYTEASNYVTGGPGGPDYITADRAKGLKLSYQYDGDSPFSGWDDTGGPWQKDLEPSDMKEMNMPNGMMTAFQFVGLAPVAYADDAGIHSFNANDRGKYVQPVGDQPAYENVWAVRGTNDFDEPSPESDTPTAIWTKLSASTAADNPTGVGGWTNAQVYGPYTLAPGQKAKLVVAYVAGDGAEYGGPGGTREDPWQWAETATKADVAKGEQALVEHTEDALFAYQSGYDIPDSPPDIDVQVKSDENAQVQLLWSAAADKATNPDYNAADIAGYRIYRGLRGTLTAVGPFNLVATIPVGGPYPPGVTFDPNADWPVAAAGSDTTLKNTLQLQADQGRKSAVPGMYSWSDPSSNAGFFYYYSIRAYQQPHDTWQNHAGTKTFADLPVPVQNDLKKGLEGPYSYPLQVQYGSPVLPFVPAADAMQRKIYVVPNPYMANGTNDYGGGIKIRFVNVPSTCYVYIFNSAGQLIQVLRKLNTTRSEISWNGTPYSTIRAPVGPGIYFFAVQSTSAASKGKIQTGTFVVIR